MSKIMENNKTIVFGAKTMQSFIFANGWFPVEGSNQSGTVKISRDLPENIQLTAGAVFNINLNTRKREGKQDPDFNLSIQLPIDTANQLMVDMKANASKRTEMAETPL